jgi:hypothetical protein
MSVFSTFLGSWHLLGLKKFGGTLTWLKMTICGTLGIKTPRKAVNSLFRGTLNTFLRHLVWESLVNKALQNWKIFLKA